MQLKPYRIKAKQMTWKLWLDDIRPAPEGFEGAHDIYEAIHLIYQHKNFPQHIAFDHDLGGQYTGYDFAKMLCDMHWNFLYGFPNDFTYSIQSQNHVGAENIRSLLNRSFEHFGINGKEIKL